MTRTQWMADYSPKARHTGSGHVGVPSTPLGARLREVRVQAGLHQYQLGALVGTQASRVSDWELGVHQPTLTVLIRYARALDTTVSKLLEGVL